MKQQQSYWSVKIWGSRSWGDIRLTQLSKSPFFSVGYLPVPGMGQEVEQPRRGQLLRGREACRTLDILLGLQWQKWSLGLKVISSRGSKKWTWPELSPWSMAKWTAQGKRLRSQGDERQNEHYFRVFCGLTVLGRQKLRFRTCWGKHLRLSVSTPGGLGLGKPRNRQILDVYKAHLIGLRAWLDWGYLLSTVGKEWGKYSHKGDDIIQSIFIHNIGHLIKTARHMKRTKKKKQKI